MKEITVILEKGNLGMDYMLLAIDGVEIKDRPIPVIAEGIMIGTCQAFIEDGMIQGKMKIPPNGYNHMFPYVGYQAISNNSVIIRKSKLVMVGLSVANNYDESIKSISEQTKKSK